MRIGIVGAGIAGQACADVLVSQGHEVSLFDKGRGPGGRMSTRRVGTALGEASFDHGAQYFTARDARFRKAVDGWKARGVVARWPAAGGDAWVGVPTMNAVIRNMTQSRNVTFGNAVRSIEKDSGKWRFRFSEETSESFDVAVVAVPAEQAAPLLSLHDLDLARRALRAWSKPCWTAMIAFEEPVAAERDVYRDLGILGWAARNSAKPGRGGPESWVLQANSRWSEEHLEDDPEAVCRRLHDALGAELGTVLPAAVTMSAHRWRFAMAAGTGDEYLWSEDARLAVCGDWLIAPRVESAWLSGHLLGQKIGERV